MKMSKRQKPELSQRESNIAHQHMKDGQIHFLSKKC